MNRTEKFKEYRESLKEDAKLFSSTQRDIVAGLIVSKKINRLKTREEIIDAYLEERGALERWS